MEDEWKKQREIEYEKILYELDHKDNVLYGLSHYANYDLAKISEEGRKIAEPFLSASQEERYTAWREIRSAYLEHCQSKEKFISEPPKPAMQDDWKQQREIEYAKIEAELNHKLEVLRHFFNLFKNPNLGQVKEEDQGIIEPFLKATETGRYCACLDAQKAIREHHLNKEKFISEPQPKPKVRRFYI